MSPEPFEGLLLRRLLELIPDCEERYVVSTSPFCPDVATEGDLTLDEVFALDPAVRIDSRKDNKRAEFQVIRGELRYCIISTRDAYEMSISFNQERGVVSSPEAAAALCQEYLDNNVAPEELTTARDVIRRAQHPES